jgi:hypothetical protein
MRNVYSIRGFFAGCPTLPAFCAGGWDSTDPPILPRTRDKDGATDIHGRGARATHDFYNFGSTIPFCAWYLPFRSA